MEKNELVVQIQFKNLDNHDTDCSQELISVLYDFLLPTLNDGI